MSRFQNLIKLATAKVDINTEFKDTASPLAGKFATALADARQKQAEQALQAAAEEVLTILNRVEERRGNHREQIRQFKVMIEGQVAQLNDLDRAMAYAEETENFLPLISIVEGQRLLLYRQVGSKAITKVPDDWVPANGKKVPPPRKAVLVKKSTKK